MSEFIDYVFQRSTSLNKIDNSLYSKYNVKNGLEMKMEQVFLLDLQEYQMLWDIKKKMVKKLIQKGNFIIGVLKFLIL